MTLALELGQVSDPSARRALEQIALRWQSAIPGPKGDTGATGPQGPQGVPGPNVMPAPDYDSGWTLVTASTTNQYTFTYPGFTTPDLPKAYQVWFSPDGGRWFPIWYGMGTDNAQAAASAYHNPSRIEFSSSGVVINTYAGQPLYQIFVASGWTTWFTGYYRVRVWK